MSAGNAAAVHQTNRSAAFWGTATTNLNNASTTIIPNGTADTAIQKIVYIHVKQRSMVPYAIYSDDVGTENGFEHITES